MKVNYDKMLFGLVLIGVTLTSENIEGSNAALYSLVAIPFIFSGLFDWRPLEMILKRLSKSLTSFSVQAFTKKKLRF